MPRLLSLPERDSQKCVHHSRFGASCRQCIDSCPHQAWSYQGYFDLNAALCSGCGACVEHCPSQALSAPEVSARANNGVWALSCERSAAAPQHNFGCLQRVALNSLVKAASDGVHTLLALCGDCKACPLAPPHQGEQPQLEQQLAQANAVLASHQMPPITLRYADADVWRQHQSQPPSGPLLSRRRLFGLKEVRTQPVSWPLPQREHARYPVVVSLSEQRCTACDACSYLCPTQAIRRQSDHYAIASERCTGCRLCLDVCPTDAIELTSAAVATQTRLALVQTQCEQCQSLFFATASAKPRCGQCRAEATV